MNHRKLPVVTSEDEIFWRGGKDGFLHFLQCQGCSYIIHPPSPICPQCYSRDLAEDTVSGFGIVETFTINYQPWNSEMVLPFVIAIVTLVEQGDLRLMTNIVNVKPEAVTVGMEVKVCFEACDDDIFLPLFEPFGSLM